MPTRLKVAASQNMPDDHHGTRSASIELEIEIDSNLVMDSAGLQERIHQLLGLVRQALAEELKGRSNPEALPPPNQPVPSNPPLNGRKPTNGRYAGATRLATPAQIKALFGITRRQRVNLHDFIRSRCGVERPEDLTLDQASELIDALTSENDSA